MTEHQPPLPGFPTPEPPSPHDPPYRTIRVFTADARFLRKLAAELDCTISAALSHVIEKAASRPTIFLKKPLEDYDLQEADAAFREEVAQQEWERETEKWNGATTSPYDDDYDDEPVGNESA